MRNHWLIVAGVLGLSGLAFALAPHAMPEKTAAERATSARPQQTPAWPLGKTTRVWTPPDGLEQIPIWPDGAPDMEDAPRTAENVLLADTPEALHGSTSEAVFDVTEPTMTVFPAQGRNSGAAVIVFPGGGFRALAITLEGTEVCHWIASKGMTCILSKYRVPGSNHYWNEDCRCVIDPKPPRALQDAQRTIRLVRARAAELGVQPDKIGVMGFSAGGYLVAQTSNIFEPIYTPVDAVDRVSSRPDFAVAFFPGHLCRPGDVLDPGIRVTARTPPTFLLQAWDDPVDPICNGTLYARALNQAEVPSEVHFFAKGGHAFALRGRSRVVLAWPSLVESWLKELGVLE